MLSNTAQNNKSLNSCNTLFNRGSMRLQYLFEMHYSVQYLENDQICNFLLPQYLYLRLAPFAMVFFFKVKSRQKCNCN